MHEQLLQYIWQHSLYNASDLLTSEGEPVTVIHPGTINRNAGPDFLDARIRIGNTTLAGHVELHVFSKDWFKHGHQTDAAYNNVVLHVVYEDNMLPGESTFPLLVLKHSISDSVLERYNSLLAKPNIILCASQLDNVRDITKESWLSRLLVERWEDKLAGWKELLDESKDDWRSLLYWRMAANFGFKLNSNAFLALARSLPLNILSKQLTNGFQVEALLFGQAGMLDKTFKDEYPQRLKKEYEYLKGKYSLEPIPEHLWKFMRLRPANFPTIRIAQFANLVASSAHLFSQIIEANNVEELRTLLEATAGSYWDTHYVFDGEASVSSKKKLGKSSIDNIIINTIAPIRFLHAQRHGDRHKQDQALQILDTLAAEKNTITDTWAEHNWPAKSAGQSQAQIQLYNSYCLQKRCLECAIGSSLLKAR